MVVEYNLSLNIILENMMKFFALNSKTFRNFAKYKNEL